MCPEDAVLFGMDASTGYKGDDVYEVEKLVEVAHMEEYIVEAACPVDFLDLLLHQAVDEAALRHLGLLHDNWKEVLLRELRESEQEAEP